MAAITDLATLADNGLADTDWFVVHDLSAATDKKIAATGVLGVSGSFTPVIAFGGAQTGITYTTQTGRYIRNGNLVWVTIQIGLSSKGSASGNAAIGNLPYSYAGVASALPVYFSNLATGVYSIVGLTDASSSITLYYTASAATSMSNVTNSIIGNTTALYITGSYRTTDAK